MNQTPTIEAIGNLPGSESSLQPGFIPGPHFQQPYFNQAGGCPQDCAQLSGESDGDSGQPDEEQQQICQLLQSIEAMAQELQQGQGFGQMDQELQSEIQELEALLGGGSGGGGGSGYGMDPYGGSLPAESNGGSVAPVASSNPIPTASSSASSPAPSGSVEANAQVVAQEARKMGVDPTTAVATMLTESGGNNKSVGDNGTSFGLFQLHQGGELGNRTEQQAFDPKTNADVALSVFAQNKGKYSDPGQLAAASQRPANPGAYAKAVDSHLAEARKLIAA